MPACYNCGDEEAPASALPGLPPRCARCVENARRLHPRSHVVVRCRGCGLWREPLEACRTCATAPLAWSPT